MVSENHSLETLKQRALSERAEVPGLESFPDSQVQIPRLIIAQPSNIGNLPEGKFVDSLTNLTYDSIDVVLMKMTRSRALWRPGKPQQGDQPLCKSQNAVIPDSGYYSTRCERCMNDDTNTHEECVDAHDRAVCEHAKFKKDQRPDCRLAYHLLVVLVETADPYILTITGKSLSPTNKILSAFKVRGRAPYSARFKISLDKAADGNYYTVKYSDIHWFETADELKNLFARFKDVQLTPQQSDVESERKDNAEAEPEDE